MLFCHTAGNNLESWIMAYQFIHVESYSRSTPKKGKAGGHSVSSVVNEAIREKNSIPHVDNPKPPVYIYGKPLEVLEETCNAWAASMTDAKGRKLRKDALCLVAGVVSMPAETTPEAWEKFKLDAVEYLKAKYGDRLETVVEHTDEDHPHLHFYVVPRPGERFESIHQGKAAAAEKRGEVKGIQNQAYKAAMRAYQDEFFERVGIPHGLSRIGPGRRRLTREAWKLEQVQAESAAKTITVAQGLVATSEVEAREIKKQAIDGAKEFAEKTLVKADKIIKAAESKGFEKGFNKGIADVESLPWWKKAVIYISSAVRERDQLKIELEEVKKDKETWSQRASRYLGISKKLDSELKEVKPKLESVEEELSVTRYKAKQAALLREENDQLTRRLGDAEHKNEGLRGRVESLKSMVDEQEAAQQTKPVARRYEHEEGLSR